MKKPMWAVLAGTLAAGLAGSQGAFAQGHGREGGNKPSFHERAEKHWAEMGLTQDQISKLKASLESERDALKALRREERDAFLKLRDLVEDKADEKEIQSALDRLEKGRKALEAEREKFRASRASFLPASIRAKLLLAMSEKMHDAMKGRRPPKGMGPGPRHAPPGPRGEEPEDDGPAPGATEE
jgi:Spy/CpxP family protein refolding chaperone